MEIQHIKEFLVLSSVCNYEEAADILYISQSSLFKHIKALEADIGVELFSKNGKRIYLNKYGQKLVPYAKRFEELDETFRRELNGQTDFSCVHIFAEHKLTELVVAFSKTYPEYACDFFEGDFDSDGGKSLGIGECDVAFMENPAELSDEEYVKELFVSKPLTLIVYEGHPLARRKVVDISELMGERFITFASVPQKEDRHLEIFRQAHYEPHIVMTASSGDDIRRMVRDRLGVALLFINPMDYKFKGTVAVNIKCDIVRQTYMCYHRTRIRSEAVDTFIKFAVKNRNWKGE